MVCGVVERGVASSTNSPPTCSAVSMHRQSNNTLDQCHDGVRTSPPRTRTCERKDQCMHESGSGINAPWPWLRDDHTCHCGLCESSIVERDRREIVYTFLTQPPDVRHTLPLRFSSFFVIPFVIRVLGVLIRNEHFAGTVASLVSDRKNERHVLTSRRKGDDQLKLNISGKLKTSVLLRF